MKGGWSLDEDEAENYLRTIQVNRVKQLNIVQFHMEQLNIGQLNIAASHIPVCEVVDDYRKEWTERRCSQDILTLLYVQ